MRKQSRRARWIFRRIVISAGVVCVAGAGVFFLGKAIVNELQPQGQPTVYQSGVQYPSSGKASSQAEILNSIDKTAWNLILVNHTHYLPENYQVNLSYLNSGHAIDSRAYSYLRNMLNDAYDAGLQPIICSSYRSMEKQTQLYQDEVEKWEATGLSRANAEKKAGEVVAYPGTGEHQLGLAVDICSKNYQILDEKQAETPEAKWLKENCYKYGFILRYPVNKSDITGVIFEPWHYRFVGVEAATEIMNKNICLEEYLGDA